MRLPLIASIWNQLNRFCDKMYFTRPAQTPYPALMSCSEQRFAIACISILLCPAIVYKRRIISTSWILYELSIDENFHLDRSCDVL